MQKKGKFILMSCNTQLCFGFQNNFNKTIVIVSILSANKNFLRKYTAAQVTKALCGSATRFTTSPLLLPTRIEGDIETRKHLCMLRAKTSLVM